MSNPGDLHGLTSTNSPNRRTRYDTVKHGLLPVCYPATYHQGMAWTVKKPSGRWAGMYRDADGKIRSAGTYQNRDRAHAEAANREAVDRGRPQQARDLTWESWSKIWWDSLTIEKASRDTYRHTVNAHLLPRWGNTPIDEITTNDIRDWIAAIDRAPATANKCLLVLSASLTYAVQRGFLTTNPCKGVKQVTARPSPERFLTATESSALRNNLTPPDQFLFDLLINTGMRWGEMCGLHWDHIDFEHQRIRVEMQWVQRENQFRPTKGKNTRWVPAPEWLIDDLKTRVGHQGWGTPIERVYNRVHTRYGPILPLEDGAPPRIRPFRDRLQKIAETTTAKVGGIDRPIGHIRIHDLRHSFASRLVQSGIDLQTVSAILGHSSIKVSERYAQVSDYRWQDVRNVLSSNNQERENQ